MLRILCRFILCNFHLYLKCLKCIWKMSSVYMQKIFNLYLQKCISLYKNVQLQKVHYVFKKKIFMCGRVVDLLIVWYVCRVQLVSRGGHATRSCWSNGNKTFPNSWVVLESCFSCHIISPAVALGCSELRLRSCWGGCNYNKKNLPKNGTDFIGADSPPPRPPVALGCAELRLWSGWGGCNYNKINKKIEENHKGI